MLVIPELKTEVWFNGLGSKSGGRESLCIPTLLRLVPFFWSSRTLYSKRRWGRHSSMYTWHRALLVSATLTRDEEQLDWPPSWRRLLHESWIH